MSFKETSFEEIKNDLAEDDGAPKLGVVPTDAERFGRAIPTDTCNERCAADPFKNCDSDDV